MRVVKLSIPKKKSVRYTVQARIPRVTFLAAKKRLRKEDISWQDLIEATVKAYGDGAIFYSK